MAKKTKPKQLEMNMEVDKNTGEIIAERGKLNEVIVKESRRPDGSVRIQYDYANCPSMTEQHTAHLSDINYLVERYKPDELAAYLMARGQHRSLIENHDFSLEPTLQEAMNMSYNIKKHFEGLSDEVKMHFRSPAHFMSFIDNPANAEKMLKLGLLTVQEVKNLTQATADTQTSPTA